MFIGFIIATVMYYLIYCIWIISRKEKSKAHDEREAVNNNEEEDVMGSSNYLKRRTTQANANDNTDENAVSIAPIFAAETVAAQPIEDEDMEIPSVIVIPIEKLDEVFSEHSEDDELYDPEPDEDTFELEETKPDVDWAIEEEELSRYRATDDDNINYASGISFDELKKLNTILCKEVVLEGEVEEAGATLSKISDTELLENMLSGLPEAMQNIFLRIEEKLSSETNHKRTPEWMSFDINKYV